MALTSNPTYFSSLSLQSSLSISPSVIQLRNSFSSKTKVHGTNSITTTTTTTTKCKKRPPPLQVMGGSLILYEKNVKRTIASYPVVIYSRTWCPYSSAAKTLIDSFGVQSVVIELDAAGPELQKVLRKLTGLDTVPYIYIGGSYIGSYAEILILYRQGQLGQLLANAGA